MTTVPHLYEILAKIWCVDSDLARIPEPYGLGDLMAGNIPQVDFPEYLEMAEALKKIRAIPGFLLATPGVHVDIRGNHIDYPWLPGHRREDGVLHLYLPFMGQPLSSVAVEQDLGYVLFACAFDDPVIVAHAYWPDGHKVDVEFSKETRELAITFLSTAVREGRKRNPGSICRDCLKRGECSEYASLFRADALIHPMPPSEKVAEARKLWLNSLLLKEASKGLAEKRKAVKSRLLALANGGFIDLGGNVRIEVRQPEKDGQKREPTLLEAGMDKTVGHASIIDVALGRR